MASSKQKNLVAVFSKILYIIMLCHTTIILLLITVLCQLKSWCFGNFFCQLNQFIHFGYREVER